MNTLQRTRIINILGNMAAACSRENDSAAAHCLSAVSHAIMDGRTGELSDCIHEGYDAPQERALLASEPLPEELLSAWPT